MAVIQEKSTFVDPDDLLDKIRAFLLSQGWTVNSHASSGSGYRLHLSKGGVYVNLHSFVGGNPFTTGSSYWAEELGNGLALNGSDGYSAGQPWDQQPGAPINVDGIYLGHYIPQVPTGNATYWFFYGTSPDAFYCIIESSPGRYRYLGFGTLDKPYSWTGGAYTMASYARTQDPQSNDIHQVPLGQFDRGNTCGGFVRATYDEFDGWLGRYYEPNQSSVGANLRFSTGNGFLSSLHGDAPRNTSQDGSEIGQLIRVPGYGRSNGGVNPSTSYAGMFERAYNTANNVAILLPVFVYGRRLGLGTVSSMLGKLPHAHVVNMRHLVADTVYTYGLQDYRVIPTYSVAATSGVAMPHMGLAFPV